MNLQSDIWIIEGDDKADYTACDLCFSCKHPRISFKAAHDDGHIIAKICLGCIKKLAAMSAPEIVRLTRVNEMVMELKRQDQLVKQDELYEQYKIEAVKKYNESFDHQSIENFTVVSSFKEI